MPEKSWISHYIVSCVGNSSCNHCKLDEPHPQQDMINKFVHKTDSPSNPISLKSPIAPQNIDHEKYLRKKKLLGTTFGDLDIVPSDPNVDPEPYACFVCWSLLHTTKHCQESVKHLYCWNCGRRDVQVDKCPRCARAYRKHLKKICNEGEKLPFRIALLKSIKNLKQENLQNGDTDLIFREEESADSCFIQEHKQFSALKKETKWEYKLKENGWNEGENTRENLSLDSHEKCKIKEQVKCEDQLRSKANEALQNPFSTIALGAGDAGQQSLSLPSSPFVNQCIDDYSDSDNDYRNVQSNELFTHMRNQKIQDQLKIDLIKTESALNYFSESEYYFFDEQEENYDDYIVDEDEKSESLYSENYVIRFFVDLLGALKHMSFDIQNSAVLNFISTYKKQIYRQQETEQKDSSFI